jgi:hypothetical protein
MMLAFRINGGVEGRVALLIAVILFSTTAAAIYNPMERLKSRLGKEVFRLRWPISHVDRTRALVFLIGLLLAPSGALIGVFGSTMGYANGPVFVLFCLQTVIACAWLLSRFSRTPRATIGQYLLALLCHGAIVFLVPNWLYIALAAAGIAAGFYVTANLIRSNAITAEICQ